MGKGGIIKRSLPILIITVVSIIAFRPVAFLQETLKYDILDGYLPGHYFISECLRNNIFPLWNPYQQLGFPIYADMLNTNYIVDMFIGRLFPYTNITFHILFIFYVILAGVGVYRLAIETGITKQFAMLAGIAYSLSGFVTGNAQHIQFIIGAAWLPFSILYFIKLARDLKFKYTLLFVIFTIFLITGGYPSFAIMLMYGLIPVFVHYLIQLVRNKEYKKVFVYVLNCSFAAVFLLLMCAGILISIKQATPFVERYVQLSYEYSVTNPFTPSSLISVIAPFVTASHPALFNTDVSMNNHYFGIVILILFIYSLSVKITRTGLLLLIASFLMLLLTFGENAFLHKIFFEYVPLFNKFRHPSSFRFITILLLLLFTGLQISKHDPADTKNFGRFRIVYVVSIVVIAAICLASAMIIIIRLSGPAFFKPEWNSIINDFGIFGPLFLQTAIFLIINVIFILLIIIRKKIEWFYTLLTLVLSIEVIVFTGMNMHVTVTSKYDPLDIRAFLRNSPAGFPNPDNLEVIKHTEESAAHFPIINNTNTYSKSVSPFYMYPFVLDRFRWLESDTLLFKAVTGNRLLYFEYSLPGDTAICTTFSPQRMVFSTKTSIKQTVVLLQNDFPGWSVTIDGKKADHHTVHKSLIGIEVPSGIHEIVFDFRNSLYLYATLGSFALIIILLIVVQLLLAFHTNGSKNLYIFNTGMIILSVLLVFKPVKPFARTQEQNYMKIKEYLDSKQSLNQASFLLFNVDSQFPFADSLFGSKTLSMRFRPNGDEIKLWNILDTIKAENLVYIWSNVPEVTGMRDIIVMHFPEVVEEYSGERFKVVRFSKSPVSPSEDSRIYLNDYEKPSAEFTREGIIYDSSLTVSGKYSEKLSGDRVFSSTFRKTLSGKGMHVFAFVKFFKLGYESCHLVISVSRKDRTIYYDAVDLENFNGNGERWNTGFMSKSFLKSSIRKGDELIVYCWNSGDSKALYLDDFFIKVY
ncbi:MAG TPA: hypothetical protein VHI78_14075 [Bacteroidales bacterium]|jgi:hypothetical protein|nr:hypothetical protein [Bacteroidales bacterium]